MPKDAADRTIEYVEKTGLLQNTARLLTAVSGGADSVFLFYVMLRLCREKDIPMEVLHVHHGIRGPEADRDAEFVEKLCRLNGTRFRIFYRDIPREAEEKHQTVEEAGRNARYQIFEAEAAKTAGTKVALAHQKNDQAETMLFNLARGTGIRGLGSLRPERGIYIRPLLDVTREEETEWLRVNHLDWMEDSTNGDDDAARNRIRHHVLPYLTDKINARSVSHLAETARIAAEVSDFIDAEARKKYRKYVTEVFPERTGSEEKVAGLLIRMEIVADESALIQEEVIRLCIRQLTDTLKDISSRHIGLILELFGRENGKSLDLPKGLAAEKRNDGVFLAREGKRQMSKIKRNRFMSR